MRFNYACRICISCMLVRYAHTCAGEVGPCPSLVQPGLGQAWLGLAGPPGRVRFVCVLTGEGRMIHCRWLGRARSSSCFGPRAGPARGHLGSSIGLQSPPQGGGRPAAHDVEFEWPETITSMANHRPCIGICIKRPWPCRTTITN